MDSAGFATTFAYNDVGWKLAETNALTNVTAYVYDMNGSVVRIVDPLQRVFIRTYDANGNLTSVSDGKPAPDKRFTFYAYDAANQRTQMVDRAGSSWTYSYTPRGKLQRITDPLTNTVQNSYDDANRLIRVTDPLVNSVTNRYDANGNLVVLIDKLGQRWRKTPDRLNRIVAESDPLGNTRRTSYDSAGRIKEIVTPKGYPSTHSYDGRGRLTKWTDAEGYVWLYTYDGVGNITDIEDALHGRYVMTYGPRNERLMEQNQDTNTWVYTYDELMRLKTQEDPNTTNRTFEYDASGRLTNTIFSTGRVNSIKYDDNNNPISLVRAHNGGSTVTGLTYDSLDRVTAVDDALFQRVEYSYDAVSRPVTITYPRSKSLTQRFDALGRLTNQVFRFDDSRDFKTVYEYDRADRLIRRTYPNGVVQTNTFDNAGRLIGLTYSAIDPRPSTINIALTYAYDKNGNKTESTERGTLDWPMPSLTDERADYTDAGRLRTRTITQLSATNSQPIPDSQPSTINYKYDASGNMTNATAPSQSWTLGYDEDNRTTTIRRDCGLGSRTIVNRYDALGRRIERIEDNGSTRYVLDLAGTMERILCELNSKDGSFNYYVHGPDLVYRVDATGALTCYHADAMANIIALSDGNGSTVAQYAYTPYGRVLGSTNLQSQISNPYLFVGSQGVMHELPELAGSAGDPGLYFMRARYYSAEAGVFLSTDPVKRVGPSWRPVAFVYASANPLHFIDGTGQEGEVFDRSQTYCGPGSDNPLTWLATWYPRLAFGLDLNFYCYRHDLDTDQAIEDKDLLAGLLASVDFWVKIRRAAGINPAAGRLADVYAVLAAAGTSFEVVHTKAHAGRSHGGSSTSGSAPAVVLPADSSLRGSPNSLTPPGDSPGTGQPLSDRAVTTVPHVQTVTAKSGTPAAPAPVKAGSTSGSATITIRWGDTLSGLAREYHTTVAGLMAVNPQISNPNKIYAGASLRLP
jgi:RHS repeat-associated protein